MDSLHLEAVVSNIFFINPILTITMIIKFLSFINQRGQGCFICNFPLRNFVGIFILTIIIFFKVIVMELCTGGSLFNLLDDPENSYGLDEVRSFEARN